MSKQNLEKALRKELESLNYRIDEKIIRGLSYAKEAERHKVILRSLSHIKRSRNIGWVRNVFANFSLV